MATYFIVSTLCSAVLFFYNIKKRFTVKITYVLTFLITYILLNYAIHSETESNGLFWYNDGFSIFICKSNVYKCVVRTINSFS